MDAANTQSTESATPRRCGAIALPDGSVRFRVWAPLASRVDLVLIDGAGRRTVPMRADDRDPTEPGHFVHVEPNVPDGQRYAFSLDGGPDRQDPCSLWQPDGVPGPSAVVRPGQFDWTDANWHGVGMARKPPRWLKPGDTVTIDVEHIGQLTNPVVEERISL